MYPLSTAGTPGNPRNSAPKKSGMNEVWDSLAKGKSTVPGFRKEEKDHMDNDKAVN